MAAILSAVIALFLFVATASPAEIIAGKYVQHSAEFLRMYPAPAIVVPDPLPKDVDALCRLIESAGPEPDLLVALGDALFARGDTALAYRAYDRAQRMGHEGLQPKKDQCEPVPAATIRAEEHEAKVWVHNLQNYERARINAGKDPRDLGPFYERFGRAEESLPARIRERQTAWWTAALSTILALALVIGSRSLPKRFAAAPLVLSGVSLIGAPAGPFLWASGALALAGRIDFGAREA